MESAKQNLINQLRRPVLKYNGIVFQNERDDGYILVRIIDDDFTYADFEDEYTDSKIICCDKDFSDTDLVEGDRVIFQSTRLFDIHHEEIYRCEKNRNI